MSSTIQDLVRSMAQNTSYDAFAPALNPQQWELLGTYLQPFDLTAGQPLIDQGAQDRTVFFIEQGALSVHLMSKTGQLQLAILNPGSVVGEGSFFSRLPRSANVVATGAWYLLRRVHFNEGRMMLHWGLGLAAVLIPVQLFFGHLTGEYVLKHQPAKFAAIEARWKNEQPASEVLIAIPDEKNERNLYAISVPKLGSFIASGNFTSAERGLESFPKEDRPPVLIPFFAFRLMVGMGLIMLAVSWLGNFLRWRGKLESSRWFLWCAFAAFPTGFVAILTGWYTAEIGRQPWVVYGLLRTRDAVTPSLTTNDVLTSLIIYVVVYWVFVSFGIYYIYKLLRQGPRARTEATANVTGSRPMAVAARTDAAAERGSGGAR